MAQGPHLHKLEGRLKVLHRVHLNTEELHPHDQADDTLDHIGTLLFVPQLFQLCHEFLLDSREPKKTQEITK